MQAHARPRGRNGKQIAQATAGLRPAGIAIDRSSYEAAGRFARGSLPPVDAGGVVGRQGAKAFEEVVRRAGLPQTPSCPMDSATSMGLPMTLYCTCPRLRR
ncbi:hypothetical protein [Thauera sinica]|uniref:Uncharacterized protein n=1 Tax=Thauera sinica TaxID=2665146 RepID=A0ABW1AM66_9RHOO|nr:hypothetical protein CCZ27_04200 [Thauera sp. K11]